MQHAQTDFSFLMYTHDTRSVQCYCVLMELIDRWIVDWGVQAGEGRCVIASKPRVVWGQIFLEWMTTKTFSVMDWLYFPMVGITSILVL